MVQSKAQVLEVPLPNFYLGACATIADPDIFFDEHVEEQDQPTERIKTLCEVRCPIQATCLNWAMVTRQKHGMWGGTTPRQREKLRRPIMRVSCPGCFGTNILEEPTSETCLGCGLTWKI